MGYKLLLVFLLILPVAIPWPHASAAYSQSKGQLQEAAVKPSSRRSTGWFNRPAEAGAYQEVVDLPNLERPESLSDYLPKNRDLTAFCRAQTRAYDEFIAANDAERAGFEAKRLSDLDPEILRLPRLYEKLGSLAAYNGDMETSIKRLETAYRLLNDTIDFFPKGEKVKLLLEEEIGVAYLRQGELQNCQLNHNAEMCILPLSVQAQHKLTASTEKAAEYFKKYLEGDPDNLEVRWLLNLTYMTLGKYPEAVPKAQLIPAAAFESRESIGRFRDVAMDVGINVVGQAGGMVADDFDNDGLLDVMMSGNDPCESLHYYHNNGDGSFSNVTARAGLSDQLGGLNCIQTDYNNDGLLDLFVMRGGWDYPMRNSLLKNNGDGTFTDVTAQSGLDAGAYRTHSAVWADFDNDGWLDVFIGHEMEPSQLFRNKGDGTFEDVSRAAGVDRTAFTKGACWGDYDNDGYVDLYVSNFGEDNFLYHNNRNGTFTEVGKQLGVEKPLMSFPCWFFDYDNDGNLDIFVASFMPSVTEVVRGFLGLAPQAETMKLYHNTGKGGFVEVTKAVGLDRVVPSMGANFGDLDNDGYLDFYLGTGAPSYAALMPNFMFRNQAGRRFVDVTGSTGTGHLQKGHGVAFSDMNNDGSQDVLINLGGAVPGDKYNKALFANPGQGNNWLSLKLTGVKSNRASIGARIKAVVEEAPGKLAARYRVVTSGGSFGSSSLTQSIGLGKASQVNELEIYWPASKTRQVFRNLAANQFLEIKESEKDYTKRPLRSFAFVDRTKPHQHPSASPAPRRP
ncbi:MAG: FG-GAP-like repeat-containing protein [Blastocatellia bacterium]